MSRPTEPDDRRRPALAALSTNLLPVVGVVLLDWSLLALLLVYWVDLGTNLAFAAVQGARPNTTSSPTTGSSTARSGAPPRVRSRRPSAGDAPGS